MSTVQIDFSKLLGFRLATGDAVMGIKAGGKTGQKVGNKPTTVSPEAADTVLLGSKIGVKRGTKPSN